MFDVEYIDHMGDDLTVVNAARVSFGKKSKYECVDLIKGRWEVKDVDKKLIWYLAEHDHKSPFNHAFATFHVKAPIFVARQLQKHEYMPWNEISRRYVDSEPEFYEPQEWRGKSEDKKQGSEGVVSISGETMRVSSKASMWSVRNYTALLNAGVCPEQARMVLPQSMMTEWYWSGSLYAFAKMCSLRTSSDAQYESKKVASKISDTMLSLYPVSWNALRTTMYKGDE